MKPHKTQLQRLDQVICRSPLFPMNTDLSEAWPTLKRLIKENAADFYPLIAELSAKDLPQQSEKVRFTVWKYFNRSRHRATPFGEFAAISTVPVQTDADPLVLDDEMELHSFPDWKAVIKIDYSSQILSKANYRTSPLCYVYREEYHYLYRSETQFDLNAIDKGEDIDLLLNYCKNLRSFSEVAAIMLAELGMKKRSLIALIKQLLELQVLQCDLQANITGQDYFDRVVQSQSEYHRYVIAHRPWQSGAIHASVSDELKEYASFMQQCLLSPSNHQLEQFKKSFLHLWEQRIVPLSLAMDPIMGIGYGHDANLTQPSLVGQFQQRSKSIAEPNINYGSLEQFLLNGMMKGKAIQLAEYATKQNDLPLPNTTAVLFHLYQGHPVIHHAGGATATALLGRFTPIEQIRQLSEELASIEQSSNPGTIFFDLAYQFEGRTDNVNRRRQLYATELAIGSWSTMANTLRLEDILISVCEGQLVLHHRENGQRLVPRLASAYNHSRSDLDLFRFLCDLQYQSIQTKLHIDLQAMFPDLDHYPRVYFKQVIACPAKWKLPQFQKVDDLLSWLAERQLMHAFTVGQGDQTLLINPKVAGDLQFLLCYQKQQTGTVYLTEALINQERSVSNLEGYPFHAEFVLPLIHRHQVYKSYINPHPATLRRDLRMPGGEWCYVELYMRPEVMDSFLTNEVKQLINVLKPLLREWFFIRYNHPETHIRLRLKLIDPKMLSWILQTMQQSMDINDHYGPLRRMEVKGYEREILRYSPAQMDKVEHFFYLDSVWALHQLRLSEDERYGQVICFAEKLCTVLFDDQSKQTAFFRQLSESFALEMRFGPNEFKKINKAYLSQQVTTQTNGKLVNCFSKLIRNYEPYQQFRLLADLIHMHVNRRFSAAQRMHEAVIYQFLYKRSVSRQHQRKGPQVKLTT